MTAASQLITDKSSEIMDLWASRVKKNIPAANESSELALRNQLTNVLEDLADIMDRYDGKSDVDEYESYQEIIENSLEHGRHRATSSHYTIKQILEEYIIFHRVLTELLIEKDVYTKEVGIVLKYSIETAMFNSATSFSDSIQEMREKLIGTLAHDIRNPISSAYFALDIIRHNDDKDRLDNLKKMGLRSLNKAVELLEGLLDAIAVKAGEGISMNFEEIDILKEIRWVYNEAEEIYTNDFVFDSSVDEIKGVFDGTAIRRVIENLVTNAVKYGSRDTPITIRIEEDQDDVLIEVQNFGNPIAKQDQNDIFKFLNRGHENQNSTLDSWGMGLTLVKTVAQAHGGKVDVVSNEKEGTTFSIHLKKQANKPGKIRTELNYSKN
ncbi:hypothetical protein JM79_1230 [Gramella sp. Hel_I_59]|uniref:sensor histidine kinase n=1 Tax=Gramella sp. Hel_I_59 TaxID=1249978 RepID=UPI0011523164|nr:HAMP domain-containing sensor histidine kinase [Gramella sp. Hel_I_59]TQI70320.1 hypothetical protein JM79_1230 [Gramella sp. Hel_I_59]